jgi:IS5 family transposase
MKSITEILGGCQMVFGISYDIQEIFEGYVTNEHRTFIQILQVIEEVLPVCDRPGSLLGRKSYDEMAMIRSCLAKQFFNIATVTALRNRLLSDPSLRQICGFSVVPSEATFSRRYASYAQMRLMEKTLGPLVSSHLEGRIVGHISRATNTKKEVKPKGKRGRPKKGTEPRDKKQSVLEKQLAQTTEQAIDELNTLCSWGCKRNSQGNNNYWKGYKLHLDVTDSGIPISAIVTGANVHDSQAAIPLERMSSERVTHLYSLMDSAYDAKPIKDFIITNGRIPIIDPNKRRKQQRVLSPAEKQRFKIRSTVERSNAHLKDWLIPSKIMVRGPDKVTHILMTGVLCLAAIKILQYCILPGLQKTA